MKYLIALVMVVAMAVPAYAGGGVGLGPLQARRLNNQRFRQELRVDRSAAALRQSTCLGGNCQQQFRVVVPQAVAVPQAAPLLIQSRTLIYR